MKIKVYRKTARKPKILLIGAKTKAHIIHEMVLRQRLGTINLIFDATLQAPEFSSKARFINSIEQLQKNLKQVTHFVVCIGGSNGYARVKIAETLEAVGVRPLDIVHPEAYIDASSKSGPGLQCMPFSVLHTFCKVGRECVLNTNSTVDHDCHLGDGVHIMGGASLAGLVEIGDYATVGTNATVLPRIKIGKGAYIGAGAVVTKDVPAYSVVVGNPARHIREQELSFDESILRLLKK